MKTQKNAKKSITRRLMVGATCMALVGVLVMTATPGVTLATHKNGEVHGGGNGNGNGGTGNVGGDVSGVIYCEVWIDDYPEGVSSDRGSDVPYIDGEDRAEMRVGRNFNIQLNFDTHKKKDAIRTLHLPKVFPQYHVPTGECEVNFDGITEPVGLGPDFSSGVATKAKLKITGQDHDDTPVGCTRRVWSSLEVTDDNGETWHITYGPLFGDSCRDSMFVTRLPNVEGSNPGFSEWAFDTGAGRGNLYRDNNPPHTPTEFWGVITLPLSGHIRSLTLETLPTGDCADFPDSF